MSESADSTPTLEHAEKLKGKVRMPSAIWVWSMHTLSIQKLGDTRWLSAIVYNSVNQMSKTVVSITAADPDRMYRQKADRTNAYIPMCQSRVPVPVPVPTTQQRSSTYA